MNKIERVDRVLNGEEVDRPRVNAGTILEEDIRMMWETSKDKYYNAADIVCQTDQKNIEEEGRELKQVVLDYFKGS